MALVYRDKLLEMLAQRELIIESSDERAPFQPDIQVTADTIDLRLCCSGLVYRKDIEVADTLAADPETFFERVDIPLFGYVLRPGDMLFSSALEIFCIANTAYTGRISSRGTFARFGISVTCGRLRVQAGTPHTPSLQIANHTQRSIRIYPYSFLLQVQLETTAGTPQPYQGAYPKNIGPVAPRLSARDRNVHTFLMNVSSRPPESHEPAAEIVERLNASVVSGRDSSLRIHLPGRVRTALGLGFGGATTAVAGFIINMVSTGDWSYWKTMSVAFASALLTLLLTVDLLLVYGRDRH